jgi:uncharacterized membrane protein
MSKGTDDEAHPPLLRPDRSEDESSSNQRSPSRTPVHSTIKRTLTGVALSLWTLLRWNVAATRADGAESRSPSAGLGARSDAGSAVVAGSDAGRTGVEPRVAATDADHPLVGVDPELLNPERRILQVLIVEGGVVEQSALVERTRWTDSTISRKLCRMETQGRIERRREGTGKLVLLPQNREN